MTKIKKIIVGASTTSVLSGGGILSYLLFKATSNKQHTTVREAFINGSLEALDPKQNGGEWDTILIAYRSSKRGRFEDIDPLSISEEILKKRCQRAFQEPNEELLALKWCTKKRQVKDVFEKMGLKFLNESSNDNDWKKLITEYYGSDSSTTIESAKEACKKFKDVQTTDDNFIDNFEEIENACVIPH